MLANEPQTSDLDLKLDSITIGHARSGSFERSTLDSLEFAKPINKTINSLEFNRSISEQSMQASATTQGTESVQNLDRKPSHNFDAFFESDMSDKPVSNDNDIG